MTDYKSHRLRLHGYLHISAIANKRFVLIILSHPGVNSLQGDTSDYTHHQIFYHLYTVVYDLQLFTEFNSVASMTTLNPPLPICKMVLCNKGLINKYDYVIINFNKIKSLFVSNSHSRTLRKLVTKKK